MNSYFSKNGFISGEDQASSSINVQGTDNVYTMPLRIGQGKQFALEINVSGSSPDVDVIIELGNEDVTNLNAADDNFTTYTGYSSPTISLTSTGLYIVPISPVVAKFMRILLDGQAGNHATDTEIEISLTKITGY